MMPKKRVPMLSRLLVWLLPLCLLLVWGSAVGQDQSTGYVGPHERAKDLTPLYGRYEIYEAVEYRGSIVTTAAEAQAWVGQEMIMTADLFRVLGDRIENPTYGVWFYPNPPEEGVVVHKSEWWSSMYGLSEGQPGGDEVIKVYRPTADGPVGPWLYLEIIGTNELWVGFDGWYYKARKTSRPVVAVGHYDYCRDLGPCSAGQGDCDHTTPSECQSGLTCTDDVGTQYGWAANIDVCEGASPRPIAGVCGSSRNSCKAGTANAGAVADTTTAYRWVCKGAHGGADSGTCMAAKATAPTPSPVLRGYVDVISRLHGPLTLYGWAYNTSVSTPSIPVEIYVSGARGTGTLAATITANQARADVNRAYSITGKHASSGQSPRHIRARPSSSPSTPWTAPPTRQSGLN